MNIVYIDRSLQNHLYLGLKYIINIIYLSIIFSWSKIHQNTSFKSSNYELGWDDGNTSKREMSILLSFTVGLVIYT